MTDEPQPAYTPRTILLATDLSARCDRALDRAVRLAAQWGARLVALTVVEPADNPAFATLLPSWRQSTDPVRLAERQLRADMDDAESSATVLVEEGEPAETIARVAKAHGAELIVTGIARDEALGRFSLGTTVNRLLRRSTVPVLIVKGRPRHDYRNVVCATDFSDASRHALESTAKWFPGSRLVLFHAYEAPFSGLVSDDVNYRRQYRQVALRDSLEFLAGVDMTPEARSAITPVVESGMPAELLREYVQEFGVDLVVLGAKGRSAALDLLIGNTANEILGRMACDALVVREPSASAEAS